MYDCWEVMQGKGNNISVEDRWVYRIDLQYSSC
jgi:hypothetical protein